MRDCTGFESGTYNESYYNTFIEISNYDDGGQVMSAGKLYLEAVYSVFTKGDQVELNSN